VDHRARRRGRRVHPAASGHRGFDVFQLSVSEVRTAGDTVVGIGTIRVRGKSSGIETDVPSAGVTTFSKGLMTHFKDYGDRQEALRAAGLG
jgi:hypothetical protein